MPLHPEVSAFLAKVAAAGGKSFHQLPHTDCRRGYAMLQASLPPSREQVARIEDRRIEGPGGPMPLRIYTPEGGGPFPVLVYFHGGGWVIGSPETHDKICRELCGRVGAVTVSVDYRLAPEHKFPAAVEDCVAATRWVFENIGVLQGDVARVAVGGDSAGGNLAAVISRHLRDTTDWRIAAQLLAYPSTRLDGTTTQSMIDNATGYRLERADMDWFRNHYLASDADGQHPDASPLLARNLAGLPPALVFTCEFDPLRDEGEDYGRALQAAGVPVVISRYDGAIHGTLALFTVMELGRQMMDESVRWLRETL